MTTLLQDVRYAFRMLLKTPVVTLVAALSLAVGIAVNAASFATVEAFLLAPLPYEDQETLTFVWHQNPARDIEQAGIPPASFLDMDRENTSFEELAAYSSSDANLTGGERPEQIRAMTATPDLFLTLGVQPARGRDFRPEEGATRDVAILHHDFWTARLGADPEVLGRTLVVDGTARTVVGVMGEDFDPIPAGADVFLPTDLREVAEVREGRGVIVVGRLAPGADVETARRDLVRLQSGLVSAYPEALEGWTVDVQRAREIMPGPTDTRLVLILTAVTLFGLLIACANVANLLLSRAESRQKEVAVRTAMGAEPRRIVRQLLTESVVLAVVAGVTGTVASRWLLQAFRSGFPPEIPDVFVPTLRPLTLAAVLAVTLGSGVLFGLAPALSLARSDLRGVLGEGSRGGTAGRGRKRLRHAFVVGEFAVALALLTGAVLLTGAFESLLTMETGFRAEGVLTFSVTAGEDRYPDEAALVRFHGEAEEALRNLPGVREAALMSSVPRTRGPSSGSYTVEGRPDPVTGEAPRAIVERVSPGWFDVLDVRVEEGRQVRPSDRADAPAVALVNRAFVEREFPDGEALGRRLVVAGRSREIVGVTEDVLHERIPDPGEGVGPAVYLPMAQTPLRTVTMAVLAEGDPGALAGAVREAVWSVDPNQPIGGVRTLEGAVADSLGGPRIISLFLTLVGGVALALAAMGVYGVLAHAVALQRRELGIRMALGAGRAAVLAMVARNGLALAAVGLAVGAPLAWAMTVAVERALAGISQVVSPLGTAAGVGAALALVALLACLVPAVRATRVDPVRALSE